MWKFAAALVAAVGLATSVPAQVFDMGGLTATLSVDAVTQSERARAASRSAFVPQRAAPGRYGMPSGGRAVSLAYAPTAELRQQAVRQYLDRIGRKTPEVARSLDAQFRRIDYATVYRGLIDGTGLRENDAADAVAAYTMLGWMISNDHFGDPDPKAVRAIRGQIAQGLAANPAFASPRTRAQLGEEMKLLFVTLHAGWQSARKEGNSAPYRDGVAALFARQGGLDLRGIAITRNGFDVR